LPPSHQEGLIPVRDLGVVPQALRQHVISAHQHNPLTGLPVPGVRPAVSADPYARVSVSSPGEACLLCGSLDFRQSLLLKGCGTGEPCRLDGLIWPKDGCASIASAAMAARDFLPLGLPSRKRAGTPVRPFLASQESLAAAILRCAPARSRVRRRSPSACRSPSRPRWSRARTAKES
jgi:hypothetical protein